MTMINELNKPLQISCRDDITTNIRPNTMSLLLLERMSILGSTHGKTLNNDYVSHWLT